MYLTQTPALYCRYTDTLTNRVPPAATVTPDVSSVCRLLSWKPGDSPASTDANAQYDNPNKDFRRSESSHSVNSHGSVVSQDNQNTKIPNTSMLS